MLMVLWTVDTNDYRRPGVQAIVRTALSGARPGAIILLHDAGGNRSQTVAALPKIIAGLHRRHYRLVTVPRLLLDNPAPRVQNIASVIGSGG
jgi:peptidoglycan-N-acetylglucosamine deacetylase